MVIIQMVVAIEIIVPEETKLGASCNIRTFECEFKLPNSNGPSAARTASKPAVHLHDLYKFDFIPTKDTVLQLQ
jgi:hypothetical protein